MRVCVRVSIRLYTSSLVDSLLATVLVLYRGFARCQPVVSLLFLLFSFVDLFLCRTFFLYLSCFSSPFPPILFTSKSGAPVHVRIFSRARFFTPLKRPPKDIQRKYKLIYLLRLCNRYHHRNDFPLPQLSFVLPFFFSFFSIKEKISPPSFVQFLFL